jgi:hypothetical protein
MLADPTSVTVSGTAISLPRLEVRPKTNVYADRATNTTLYVTQDVNKKGDTRVSVSLVRLELYTDPLTGIKSMVPTSVSVSATIPLGGSTATAEALFGGLNAYLTASTNAILKRVLAGEK